ncbi:MAG TPA: hypothetical protein VJN18_23775 [Polyangiaceae bacterium]|nr:hypothetical protein [Polyangiaceae bacterium]
MELTDGVRGPLGEALRKSPDWTLALDESGQFEQGTSDLVLGGVLLPGTPDETRPLVRPYLDWCQQNLAGKSHAKDVPDALKSDHREAAAKALEVAGGSWLFVVADSRDRDELHASLGSYVRLLAATVDLAARLAAYCGVKTLHLRPAQRTIPLPIALLNDAIERGLAGISPVEDKPTPSNPNPPPKARPMAEAEVRSVLEALGREPVGTLPAIPASGSVRVTSANREYADRVEHPAMLLADVGCNGVLNALRRQRPSCTALLEPFLPGILVPLRATSKLRSIDRAFRETPAALVRGAKMVAELHADVLGQARNAGDQLPLRQGAYALSQLMWSESMRSLVGTPDAAGRTRSLAALAEVELETFSGSYEGLALALEGGWYGDGAIAAEHRARVPTRELAARLWHFTFTCANHRGDHVTAQQALRGFGQIAENADSLHLAAETFDMRYEAVVARQNAFPCEAEAVDSLTTELERDTNELLEQAASIQPPRAVSLPMTRADSDVELRLWRTGAGREPAWLTPNRQLGMSLGTSARSRAFLGRFDQATTLAFESRAHFDSPLDLSINAAYMARIELERARLDRGGVAGRAEFLAATLELCGASSLASDPDGARLLSERLATRFAFDIALRALLWAPQAVKPTFIVRSLAEEWFIAALTRGNMRSHPTELLARHGAEILRAKNMEKHALRLFDVSLELCGAAKPGTTLARFMPFTQALRDSPKFRGSGPPGSLLNPTFEYR